MKKCNVELSAEERATLLRLIRTGKAGARRLRRARTLLLAHEGRTDEEIASALHVGRATVARTRRRFAREGLESTLGERPRPGGERKLSPKQEAHLMALACSEPPEGRERWTFRLLAGRMVDLGVVDSLSYETVRRTLKKTRSSRGRRSSGAWPRSAPTSCGEWKTCSISTPSPTTQPARGLL